MASANPAPPSWNRPLNFVCAVDGRPAAKHAFDSLLSLVKKGDHVTALHVHASADKEKDIPFEGRPAAVREYYSTRAISRVSPRALETRGEGTESQRVPGSRAQNAPVWAQAVRGRGARVA